MYGAVLATKWNPTLFCVVNQAKFPHAKITGARCMPV
jgi:hypothetical protein